MSSRDRVTSKRFNKQAAFCRIEFTRRHEFNSGTRFFFTWQAIRFVVAARKDMYFKKTTLMSCHLNKIQLIHRHLIIIVTYKVK